VCVCVCVRLCVKNMYLVGLLTDGSKFFEVCSINSTIYLHFVIIFTEI